ncbi:MAG: hypothetical protein GC201_12490 [Alphaproteobacteria bacterium]|nr:hypothetical protein [Alphaproteobacteria bacterium]
MKRLGILILLAGGLLGGCASQPSVTSEVTRFHHMPTQGGAVAVVAADARRSGTPEFRRLAGEVATHLTAAGFPPASGAPPEYVAELDYFMQPVLGDSDRDDGPRMSIGVGGGTGGRGSSFGVGVGTSFDLGGGDHGGNALRTVTLVIERRDSGERIFEGRARSTGPAEHFGDVLPSMIDALFDGFPGESGRTVTVETTVDRDRR